MERFRCPVQVDIVRRNAGGYQPWESANSPKTPLLSPCLLQLLSLPEPKGFVQSGGAGYALASQASGTPLASPQVPIHALWNDGRENLLGALLMAGQYIIPEVSGLATWVAWVEGECGRAGLWLWPILGWPHRAEVGIVFKTLVPYLTNKTTVTSLELSKPRKEKLSLPPPLPAARFCVVETVVLHTCNSP